VSGFIKILPFWKPFDREFGEVLNKFRVHRDNVEKEANLCHMIEEANSRALVQAEMKGKTSMFNIGQG
jgi:hypothetical protein